MRTVGGGVNQRRRRCLHRYAGHLARMTSGMPRSALRIRSLAWWRFRKSRFVSKHCGLHPKRFSALSRWEAQLTAAHGEAKTEDVEVNVGWLSTASDRVAWKGRESAFARRADACFFSASSGVRDSFIIRTKRKPERVGVCVWKTSELGGGGDVRMVGARVTRK